MSIDVETTPQDARPADSRIPSPVSSEQHLTLIDVWRVLMKQRFVILVVTILSVAGATWYSFRTTPLYESIARLEIRPQQMPNVGLQQIISQGQSGQESAALQTEIRILQSDSVLFETAQSLNLLDLVRVAALDSARKQGKGVASAGASEITAPERREMIGIIRGGLAVTVLQGTNLVDIRYRGANPKLAAAIANRLADTYADVDLRSKFERTMHVSTWLQGQLKGLKGEAADAQRELVDYQKAHNIVGTNENSNLTIQTLGQLSTSLDTSEADRIKKEARMRDFDSLDPNLVALMGDNPSLAALRSHLADLQTQRAELSAKFGPKHPRMIDLQVQINKTQAGIDHEVALARRQVRNQYEGAVGVENALRTRLGAQKEAAFKLNEGAAQYAILRNQAELTRNLYDTLQMRLKEATVSAGLSAANITVVDSAQVPYLPVAPRKRQAMMLGLLGGIVGGCVLAFLIESIDDRLQTSDEVESVTMLPSLAAIPHLSAPTERRKIRGKKDVDFATTRIAKQLITLRDSKSSGAEAYRVLRSALLLSNIDNPPRIIVVTSAFPEEGKTTTAINLAIVLAQRGERVLLVDADLRRGSLGATFKVSSQSDGLTTVLARPDAYLEIPVPLPELAMLHVLSTGPRPPNPAEMLSSNRMKEQLHRWSQEYDRIVLDTAPLLAVSDTQSMAVLADSVVLVTRAGMTRRRALIRARDLLLRINAPISGVVVNDVDVRLENFYTYKYGSGYGYGGYYGSQHSDRAYGYKEEDEETK